jgi:hypothetical protein
MRFSFFLCSFVSLGIIEGNEGEMPRGFMGVIATKEYRCTSS